MENDLDHLKTILATCGWRDVAMTQAEQEAGLNGVFCCEYAIVGVILAEGAGAVLSSWAPSQAALADRRKGSASDCLKDAYVLFLLDRIGDEQAARLVDIMSDTHECRKVCVSLEKRALEDAVRDLPFLCGEPLAEEMESPADTTPELRAAGLSPKLLKDLAGRSADAILQNLMSGQYQPHQPRKDRHADQETDP